MRNRVFWPIVLVLSCRAAQAYVVQVDDYGAIGDGVTWDHDAIQEALNAAGPGGVVEFSSGKVYVQCAYISPLAGQTIRGNGATLKRCDAVTAVLSAPASVDDTILIVDKPWVFKVGQSVTPVKGEGGIADGEYGVDRWLVSSDGTSIEIFGGLRQEYPTGSVVTVKFNQIDIPLSSTNVTIEGLVFDGNRSNNDLFRAWTDNLAIRGYTGLTVRNNVFRELPGNGLTAYGTDVVIDDNVFTGLDGPIVHLSGNEPIDGSSVTISRNRVESTNRQWKRMDHSEGVITISALNYSINVVDNTVRNAPVPFIGQFHSFMSDWVVTGNRVYGTEGAFTASTFAGGVLRNVAFQDNVFVDVGLSWSYGSDDAEPIDGFVFRNNTVMGGALQLSPLSNSVISDNAIKSCGITPLELSDSPSLTVDRNVLADDYCLLSVTAFPASLTVEAPAGWASYRFDVVDTEEEGFEAGVEIASLSHGGDAISSCSPSLPVRLSAGQTMSCWVQHRVVGTVGQVIDGIATVMGSTAAGRSLDFTAGVSIQMVDTTPPMLSLVGPERLRIRVDQPYKELGATAYDLVDGDIVSAVVIDSSRVVTSQVGEYVVTYSVTDAAGNSATVERIVRVVRGGRGAFDAAFLLLLAALVGMSRRRGSGGRVLA